MFEKYDIVIFDFDSTIAILDVDWTGLKHDLSERFGLEFGSLELVLEKLPENVMMNARNMVEEREISGTDGMKPIEKTMNVIKSLSGESKKLALFTGNSRASIMIALEKIGLTGVFDIIITREDVKKHKPDPEGLNIIIEKTGVPAENAIYIGDKQTDVAAGAAAGVKTIFVSELDKELEVSHEDK